MNGMQRLPCGCGARGTTVIEAACHLHLTRWDLEGTLARAMETAAGHGHEDDFRRQAALVVDALDAYLRTAVSMRAS